MFDYAKIRDQVTDYLTAEFENGFDVDAIMDELRDIEPEIQGIDDVDADDFTDILQRHEISEEEPWHLP